MKGRVKVKGKGYEGKVKGKSKSEMKGFKEKIKGDYGNRVGRGSKRIERKAGNRKVRLGKGVVGEGRRGKDMKVRAILFTPPYSITSLQVASSWVSCFLSNFFQAVYIMEKRIIITQFSVLKRSIYCCVGTC